MSFFGVTVETIDSISPIAGADRIQVATFSGSSYQFVIRKDSFVVGDKCVYFPVDSIIPHALLKHVGLDGKLHGKEKNRVKTIKLKKQISQGLVLTVQEVGAYLGTAFTGTDITTQLGVVKYEPPTDNSTGPSGARSAYSSPRHSKVHYYDIEGTDRNKGLVEALMETDVCVTEKLEGMNIAVLREINGDVTICSRNCTVAFYPGGRMKRLWKKLMDYFKEAPVLSQHEIAANNSKLVEKIEYLARLFPGKDIIIRGEVLGPAVLGNIYKLDKHKVMVFDIQVNGEYLNVTNYIDACAAADLETPPILWFDGTLGKWLDGKSVAEMSDGQSKLYSTAREGIVIKPMHEEEYRGVGRVLLKKRSPEYLSNSEL